jgi:deoxyadenosine/deoxycytidine kinase
MRTRSLTSFTDKDKISFPFVTISIEGNIASGKSTVVTKLSQLKFATTILEPLPFWQAVGTDKVNLLQLFYQDTTRWLAAFQSYVTLTFMREYERAITTPFKIVERSLWSADVFLRKGLLDGKILEVDYALINQVRTFIFSELQAPEIYIYIRVPPETSYERLRHRSRFEEAGVPMEYLIHLSQLMDNWLLNEPNTIVIDGSGSPAEVFRKTKDVIERLYRDFMRDKTKSCTNLQTGLQPSNFANAENCADEGDQGASREANDGQDEEIQPNDSGPRATNWWERIFSCFCRR